MGLAMDDNIRKELCIRAFENACKARDARGMIYNSYRGSQITSHAFRESLAKRDAIQSMSDTGGVVMITQRWKAFCYAKERKAVQDQHGALSDGRYKIDHL